MEGEKKKLLTDIRKDLDSAYKALSTMDVQYSLLPANEKSHFKASLAKQRQRYDDC